MRVIFDASGTILEQNDYYAFGGKHLNSSLTASDNRFKYNGKEFQTTGDIGFLDYGARMYDSKIGRWFVPDPLQEGFYGINSYAYCFNDPVRYVDMFGLYPEDDKPAFEMPPIGDVFVTPEGEGGSWAAFWGIIAAQGRGEDEKVEEIRRRCLEASRYNFDVDKSNSEGAKLKALLKGYGSEIFSQWMTPELVVAGLSGGIAGLQVVKSPFRTPAKVGKGAAKAVQTVEIKPKINKTQIAGGKITGYTRHGLNQVIGRDGGKGVSPAAILDAVNNPRSVVNQSEGRIKYIGNNATVITNRDGKIITAFGKPRGK